MNEYDADRVAHSFDRVAIELIRIGDALERLTAAVITYTERAEADPFVEMARDLGAIISDAKAGVDPPGDFISAVDDLTDRELATLSEALADPWDGTPPDVRYKGLLKR